ncbi:hypothetical protein P4S64_19320 [Vibrio sp. M60_M31a]
MSEKNLLIRRSSLDAELNEETNDSKKKRITHTLGLKAEAPKLADKMRVYCGSKTGYFT